MKTITLTNKVEKRKRDILEFISLSERNGVIPSVREIGAAVGIPSSATVHSYLKKLEEEGQVSTLPNGKKTVRILNRAPRFKALPLLSGSTYGGNFFHPSRIMGTLPISSDKEGETFALIQNDSSLSSKGIMKGDILICKRTNSAREGDTVVYADNDRLLTATFSTLGSTFVLSTDNTREETSSVTVYGKVIELRRRIVKDKEE